MEKIFFLKKFASNYAELLIFTVMGVPTLTFSRLQRGCLSLSGGLSFYGGLIHENHPYGESKKHFNTGFRIMAVDIWCTIFFFLNLRSAKQINKVMLR